MGRRFVGGGRRSPRLGMHPDEPCQHCRSTAGLQHRDRQRRRASRLCTENAVGQQSCHCPDPDSEGQGPIIRFPKTTPQESRCFPLPLLEPIGRHPCQKTSDRRRDQQPLPSGKHPCAKANHHPTTLRPSLHPTVYLGLKGEAACKWGEIRTVLQGMGYLLKWRTCLCHGLCLSQLSPELVKFLSLVCVWRASDGRTCGGLSQSG